jgi:glycine/D-amino acid oxidase-like deaminating enzyme
MSLLLSSVRLLSKLAWWSICLVLFEHFPHASAGAGVIGCSIAYHLAQRGAAHRATIIEAVDVGHAASGKAGGFLARSWCDSTPLAALARLSFDMHAQLAEELGNPAEYRRLDTLAMRARAATAGGPAKRSSGKPQRIAGDDDSDVAPAWIDAPGVRDISRIGSADAR